MRSVFISYRRDDTQGEANHLADDLKAALPGDRVFLDVTAIAIGRDFRRAIEDAVGTCDVLIVMIGRQWLDARDEAGTRRLDDPQDFIRLETAHALRRDIPVVPVLVQGAAMPRADQLPADLEPLAWRNAFELRHARWKADVAALLDGLRVVFAGTTGETATPGAAGGGGGATGAGATSGGHAASGATTREAPPAPWWRGTPGVVAGLALVAAVGTAIAKSGGGGTGTMVDSAIAAPAETASAPATTTGRDADATGARRGVGGGADAPVRPVDAGAPRRQEPATTPTPPPPRGLHDLVGRWTASGAACDVVVTRDDGRRLDGRCAAGGFHHRISGQYTSPTEARVTIERTDPQGCSTSVSGTIRVVDREHLIISQPGWSSDECAVHTDASRQLLTLERASSSAKSD